MTVLTRYLLRRVLGRFLLLLVGMSAFMLGLDLMVNANRVLAAGTGAHEEILRYAAFRLPIIASELIRIAALLAGLLSLTALVRSGELAAIWASGISQFGLMARLLPLGIVLAGLQFAIDETLVPANQEALRVWGVVDVDNTPKAVGPEGIVWIQVDQDIVRIPQSNISAEGLSDFTIFQRNEQGALMAQIDVSEAQFDGTSWRLQDVTVRGVNGPLVRREAERRWDVDLDARGMRDLLVPPRELSFSDLLHLSTAAGSSTWAPALYRTWAYTRVADTLAPFLMLVLSVVLAQQSQRSGRVAVLLLGGVAIGFGFFIFGGVTLAMGEAALLPPLLAAGAPPLVLIVVAASVGLWQESRSRPAPRNS